MPLPPAVELAPSCKIRMADGTEHRGKLVAAAVGIGCEWTRTEGRIKRTIHTTRDWFVLWTEVTSYEIVGTEQRGGVGAAFNHTLEHASTTLTLHTAAGPKAWSLKMGPAQVTNRLGPFLAGCSAPPRQ
ncbi:MAG: hypothetical protein ACR2NJ_04865 [Acidimicrobiales bacterium]